MSAKTHYDNLLSAVYSWMTGDFDLLQSSQENFFVQHNLFPQSTKSAIDLGAGHGIQTISLAKMGYNVIAVDFSARLLSELKQNTKGFPVETSEDDIRNIRKYASKKPELIICMGDTLTHLESTGEIKKLLEDCVDILQPKGRLVLSFRDYSNELKGNDRFIPVKNDGNRILTVFLEYFPGKVRVTDLLHEKNAREWELKVSSYEKIRLLPEEVVKMLVSTGMEVEFNQPLKRMVTIIAVKRAAGFQL